LAGQAKDKYFHKASCQLAPKYQQKDNIQAFLKALLLELMLNCWPQNKGVLRIEDSLKPEHGNI
jgi:hypothetical protein